MLNKIRREIDKWKTGGEMSSNNIKGNINKVVNKMKL